MSTAPWTSTILQKPQTPAIFSVITTSNLPSLPYCNSQFQKRSVNLAVKPLNFSFKPLYDNFSQEDDDEEPAIGDCIVYEEGVFNDPYLENTRNLRHSDARTTKANSIKDADISPENLIPEEWLDVQKDLNITKKERRKMAQELEYGRTVEKRRLALLPLNSEEFEKAKQEQRKRASMPLDSEQFEKRKQEKLKQLSPVVLDNPKKAYFRVNEKRDEDTSGVVGGGRVAPRNPRLAVYGGGLEDVSAVFSSGKYDRRASDRPQGTRKLFSNEEKSMMNTRVPDVTLATSGKWHPLHTLVAAGEFYLVNSLLKHNLDINTPDKNGLTTIHRAILAKKQAIFNFLLRESANPFVRDNEGATLLHYAVFAASSQMIKILLLYNVDINLQDKDGWSPLHLAVQSRRTDILRLLLIKGADKTLKNKDGFTALDLCLYSGRDARTYELIKLLKRIY